MDSDVEAIRQRGPRQALLELLSEDDFGLWEIAGFFEKAQVGLPKVQALVGDLQAEGILFIEGREGSEEKRVPLPDSFDLSSAEVWAWPSHSPPVLYWAGLVESDDRHLIEGTRMVTEAAIDAILDEVGAKPHGYHVHFDDPRLDGLAPTPKDLALIEFAASIASRAARRPESFIICVPLAGDRAIPDSFGLDDVVELAHEPPAVYSAPDGWGASAPGARQFPIVSAAPSVMSFISFDPDPDHAIDPETPPFRVAIYHLTGTAARTLPSR